MANCSNCGAKLSCGCQRKTASDGKQGCMQCIPAYEQKLKQPVLVEYFGARTLIRRDNLEKFRKQFPDAIIYNPINL